MTNDAPVDDEAAARTAHLESLPARTMDLDGTLWHCGVALVPLGTGARWSGILELRTQKLRCPACDAEVRIDERVPVGPSSKTEEWAARALAKARRIVEGGDGNIGKSFVTGGVPPRTSRSQP